MIIGDGQAIGQIEGEEAKKLRLDFQDYHLLYIRLCPELIIAREIIGV
ncbi:hypothetical protein VB714_12610 [Spirulina sp. 06S082]|nr:hypothetical protein [Spirulina sp. 06S082]